MLKKINKKLITMFLVTLLVISFSLLGVLLFFRNTHEGNKGELKVSAVVDIGQYWDPQTPEPDDIFGEFEKYSHYIISNKFGFITFAEIVNGKYKELDKSFAGKTITLTTDLDLGGESVCIKGKFAGIFDGGGYTISNISLTEDEAKMVHEFASREDKYNMFYHPVYTLGFFNHVTGTIKNLGISDVKLNFNINGAISTQEVNIIMAGLGAFGDGAGCHIQNCKAENITLESATVKGIGTALPLLNGLIGHGSANVENCFTNNIVSNLDYGYPTSFGPAYHIEGGNEDTSAFESESISITNCVAANAKYVANKKDNAQVFTRVTDSAQGLSSISHEGGTIEDVNEAWYHASDYNDGWPLLRVFMKDEAWKDVNIVSNPSECAAAGYAFQTIKIPKDAYKTFQGTIPAGDNGAKIVIYDQEVIVKPKSGYRCTKWECNGATSYTVYLEGMKFTLIFKDAIIETPNGPITIKPSSATMEVPYGETLETMKSGNQYIYKYETDSYGMAVVYDLGEANEYVLVSWDLPNEENSWVVGEDYDGTDYIIEITPTFKLKDYGWIFM